MMESTLWALQPHTRAKHTIMRAHLGGWFPKLAWTRRLLVIDSFAGPGEYSGGELGSPVHAIDVAVSHRQNLSDCSIDFLFIEQRKDRYDNLRARLDELNLPPNIHIEARLGEFEEVLTSRLNAMGGHEKLPACFAMIDPFGFGGVPMRLLERLGRNERADVLISFMYDSINRFLTDANKERSFDSLFGSPEWRRARFLPDLERRRFLLDIYVSNLKERAFSFIRTFEMRDINDRTEYFLVFGTNHIEGIRVMKAAMWSVDPSGRYLFSDATNPNQMILFGGEPDFGALRRMILEQFVGKPGIEISKLEEWILAETPFREVHIREEILERLKRERKLIVTPTTSRGYPAGTRLLFLP